MKQPQPPKTWTPEQVARRVDRARGVYPAATGKDLLSAEIGGRLGWHPATVSEVRSAKRALRIEEDGEHASLLECSPGWLAFGEGRMVPVPATTPGVPMDDTEEDAMAAIERDLAQRPPAKPAARKAVGRKRS